MIKKLNDCLDKIIDKSKSLEDQIKLFKKSRKSEYISGLQRLW